MMEPTAEEMMGRAMSQSVDNEVQEMMRKLFDGSYGSVDKPLSAYERAEKAMNEQLKEKGLPEMKKILEVFYEKHPECEL